MRELCGHVGVMLGNDRLLCGYISPLFVVVGIGLSDMGSGFWKFD